MESKLIKVKTDGDILRDAYIISGFDIDGSEYVVYYIDRDDGENDNIFVSKLIKNNDGTYNMLNIENANEKINVSNIVKQYVKYAIDDTEHDTLSGNSITLGARTIKISPVIINREQAIDIQKTYITTVKKSVTAVTKKYYDIPVISSGPEVQGEVFPTVENSSVFVNEVPVNEQQSQGSIVSSVTTASDSVFSPVAEQTVPTVVEPVLPILEAVPPVLPSVDAGVVNAPVTDAVVNPAPISSTPVASVQTNTPVLDIPAGMIDDPGVQNVVSNVASTPVVEQPVVQPQPSVAVNTVLETPQVSVVPPVVPTAQSVVEQSAPVVNPASAVQSIPAVVAPSTPVVETPEPSKLVLDASKESNLNSALGEISKESIAVNDINAIKEFGVDDTSIATKTEETASVVSKNVESAPKVLTKKAGFANSKFFMFIAIGFFVASCIFMGYEAFSYYQIIK